MGPFYKAISFPVLFLCLSKMEFQGEREKLKNHFRTTDQFMRIIFPPPIAAIDKKSMNYKSNMREKKLIRFLLCNKESPEPFMCCVDWNPKQNRIHNKCSSNILCVKIYLQLKLRPKTVDKSFNYCFNFSLWLFMNWV